VTKAREVVSKMALRILSRAEGWARMPSGSYRLKMARILEKHSLRRLKRQASAGMATLPRSRLRQSMEASMLSGGS
jgi:hypothetical protein